MEFDLLVITKAELQLLKFKLRFFEGVDKVCKLLFHQAWTAVASRPILRLKSPAVEIISDLVGVNELFSPYYSELYTSECSPDIWEDDNPLDQIPFPKVDENLARGLGDPMSIQEIQEANKSLQSSKSPSPDRYSVKFYKQFPASIPSALQEIFVETFLNGSLLSTPLKATITLILKKDIDSPTLW